LAIRNDSPDESLTLSDLKETDVLKLA
jgi:hypothetical protein